MLKKIEIKISLLIFCYGLFANNPLWMENKEKAYLGIVLFLIPLAFQFCKINKLAKIYAIWFGIFLVLQSILFAVISNQEYKTLKADLDYQIDVKPGIIEGITGIQKIATDFKGYRTTKEINYRHKDKNTYRIFTIGGSTTEQIYIDQHKTSSHLLQEALSKKYPQTNFEVINTGLSGLRSVNHLANLEKIINYHPDMIIFLMGINDWNHHIITDYNKNQQPDNFYSKTIILARKLTFEISWDKFYVPIRNFIKLKILGIKHTKELNKSNIFPDHHSSLFLPEKIEFKPQEVDPKYAYQLNQINKICDEHKIKCVFLTQPNGYKKSASAEYRKTFWMTPANAKYTMDFDSLIHISGLYNQYMKDFTRKNNKILCDIDSEIPPSMEYMYDDCHFTLKGAKRVSELVFKCVENKL